MLSSGRDFISLAVAIVVGSSLLMARLNRFLSFLVVVLSERGDFQYLDIGLRFLFSCFLDCFD